MSIPSHSASHTASHPASLSGETPARSLRQELAQQPATSTAGLLRGALGLGVITLAGFGFLYSLAGVGLGQALFPAAANGSVVEREGRVVGSALVAQPFAGAGYFHPRPSAAGYNPMALAGSNQARTHAELRARVDAARAAVAQREGVAAGEVPSDLVTQSGSGSDPHLSPQAVAIQVGRVAGARGMERAALEALVARHTEPRQWGVLGAPRINVLALNLALDRTAGTAP
ncbi:potassium-transporting ATPase subunit KdpC [Comamonas endophytica]|uniref:Potassium-transporting ATPase KdpC subunit n=1 Tax=Comamonas endophytica TaxID=2949090 RepID=A0ABY6GB47_9BURK|nr:MULTISPECIES: potassium-transporting ATPase subunit KdpC [unclassified Acidovorax]MCD2513730.1 potassium-transporting ATPase subunit KdpC [Acidovorax sp. D4N7]UYG52265.1 potassium-transporting ATPase subunit KdpC [Acidovorax sp. 5MLIR]